MNINYADRSISLNSDLHKDENLLGFLLTNNINIKADCGKVKKCGKCKVQVKDEKINYKEDELEILSEKEIANGTILSCFHKVGEFNNIYVDEIKETMSILTTFKLEKTKNHSRIKKVLMDSLEVSLEENHLSITDIINKKLEVNYDFSLKALRELSYIEDITSLCLVVEDDSRVLSVSPNVDGVEAYSVAIDIGATTIAILLLDTFNNSIIDSSTFINPQANFGADVISRIQYNNENKDSLMNSLLVEKLHHEISTLIENNNISKRNVYHIAIAGNTTMLYFLTGMNPTKLSVSPFTTINLTKQSFKYYDIFHNTTLDSKVTILPGVSAYVGADIISGLYQCNVFCSNKNILFIDIGTNGEIALRMKDKSILCASTAAGPAFEGANIRNGIGGVQGAISKFKLIDSKSTYETIGNQSPIGICGSGVVDIISELLNSGELEENGRLSDKNSISITNNIDFYQEDIREVQLAKSAIAAGVDVLLKEANLSYEDIDVALLAGGFGNKVDIDSAMNIGLLSKKLKGKISSVGNTSLGGCVRYLCSDLAELSLEEIKSKTKYIELSRNPHFNEAYINNMFFGDPITF